MFPGWLRLAPAERDGTNGPVGGNTSCQRAHVAVIESATGPKGDLDGLFAVGDRRGAARGLQELGEN